MSSNISRPNPSQFPNLNEPVWQHSHTSGHLRPALCKRRQNRINITRTCWLLVRQDSSWMPSFHATICGQPAQRYLRETLCCIKRIIQSLMPCPAATDRANNAVWQHSQQTNTMGRFNLSTSFIRHVFLFCTLPVHLDLLWLRHWTRPADRP